MHLHRLIFLIVISTVLTIHVVNADTLAPERITGARTISTETAKLLMKRGYPVVDVRGKSDFDKGHLPGAYHLSVNNGDFTVENLNKIASIDQAVIIYCNGVACLGSAKATELAIQWGWHNVFYYRDGYKGWREAGY
ncbi:rhodanese-like domain-containing protein [Nitrosomonas sp.]|uniref:rhodanese-like domain-containing protein n=1 Tax=Nitrosomonas sp. TaxID=42353 RepID=UPI001D1F6030|nr:rhodanese-like domain-containing protein [Nitrosomonas sp.]MCB1947558.1 rhodanese-like domain-containing protein [Nitrosomonas sp.]MCP5244197.1 rhodanese-like domain-containing protein [Burkholderiales bacterium]MDR4515249.1 rhodanese-like domain-containing protein [Nitrosomonas sp.]